MPYQHYKRTENKSLKTVSVNERQAAIKMDNAYLPTCLKQKAGQNLWKSGTFGQKAGHSYKLHENGKLRGKNGKLRGKILHKDTLKKAGQSKEKAGQRVILNQKSGLSREKRDGW